MHVVAVHNRFEECPSAIAAFGSSQSETDISIGRGYEVYAVSVFKGVVFLQIVNDIGFVDWLPSWFFEIRDTSVPSDWIFSLPGGDLQLIAGPNFVAANEESYNKMVELDPELVATFWRRLEAR